jgi:hypothetical protein
MHFSFLFKIELEVKAKNKKGINKRDTNTNRRKIRQNIIWK